jgi:uncharacterized membrane protein YqgA involved in biofilm formation
VAGLGTAINVATVIGGTAVGLAAGGRLPERARTTVLQSVGLITLALGVGEALRTHNVVFPLVAIVAGGLIGEALKLEDRLEGVGERIRRRVNAEGHEHFVEGFVAASLLFCVGPLAVLGSIQDGLNGDVQLLVVKSALDGLVAIIFAATLGWGVGFSALPVLIYQGALTLLAGSADAVLTDRMILEGTATGGIMVMGIAFRLLELKQVRVGSLLPALVLAPVLVALFAR